MAGRRHDDGRLCLCDPPTGPAPGWRSGASAQAAYRRQAAMQRRVAAALLPLAEDGYLVLHDVALPGWLDALDHLVVGPTGVWVVGSWRAGPGSRCGPCCASTAPGR